MKNIFVALVFLVFCSCASKLKLSLSETTNNLLLKSKCYPECKNHFVWKDSSGNKSLNDFNNIVISFYDKTDNLIAKLLPAGIIIGEDFLQGYTSSFRSRKKQIMKDEVGYCIISDTARRRSQFMIITLGLILIAAGIPVYHYSK